MQKYKGNQLSYEKGADLVVGRTEFVLKLQLTQLIEVALQQQYKAKTADVVIMNLGEHGFTIRSEVELILVYRGYSKSSRRSIKVNPNVGFKQRKTISYPVG
jgi:beta-glucosidase